VTIAEIAMKARAHVEQEIPTSYNGFAYVIDGAVGVGEDGALLKAGQVGWLDRPEREGTSVLRMVAGEEGARIVLYAGQPQGDPIVSHGPFIGGSKDDIVRLYAEYRAGRFDRLSDIARRTRIA
jgi:quercetin 2,3-dioxygenase